MQSKFYHRTTCRLCDGPRVELVVEIEPIPLAEKYVTSAEVGQSTELFPVDLYQCLDCGHVQILDVIHPDVLWKDYTYHSGQTRGIVEHFEELADRVMARYLIPKNSLAIDIGSNDGSLLAAFQRHSLRVLGVDPAEQIAAAATQAGIETLPVLFTPELARQLHHSRGSANLITAFNVFAHTDDMAGMAEGVRILLDPQGIFVFEAQYLRDIVEKTLLGTIFHEHLCHHSVKPLISFLRRHQLELIDIERVTIQNGSIVGTVQHIRGPHPVSAKVAEMVAEEDRIGLDTPAAVRVLGRKLASLREAASELLSEWKSQGKSVAGYGAARSGPTLINQLGLGKAIGYVFDDHPQKLGMFTPGNHFKVVATSELCQRRPDYVIILAWIHAKKIIANHQDYLAQGGRFVVLCPEVQIVGAGQELRVNA